MKSRDFCYWLQGIFEVANPETLNKEQVKMIKAHLALVFVHEIDPSFPAEQQQALNTIHESGKIKPHNPFDPGDTSSSSQNPIMRC